MRVLVTGATGYVGTAVVRRFIMAGHDVSALTRAHRQVEGDFHIGDLLSLPTLVDAVRGVDAV